MTIRAQIFTTTLALTFLGCAAPGPELRVRNAAEGAVGSGEAGLEQANSLYARGEYALAIEAYRKTARFEPRNARAYEGLAASYERIGRFDLADRHFQFALAIEPRNPALVAHYAQALERQGLHEQASRVAGELQAARNDGPTQVANDPSAQDHTDPPSIAHGSSVTIQLDPAPATASARTHSQPLERMRLERVSLAEVKLVSRAPPVRQADNGSIATGRSVTIALDDAVAPPRLVPGDLRILNAVGRRGQAARMRAYLEREGLRGASIGDASGRLQHSRLITSPQRSRQAQALASRLPFAISVIRSPARPSAMMLVLGANATRFDEQLKSRVE